MKDEYKEFFETDENDKDSKSDAKVILFLIVVAVIAMTYWVAMQDVDKINASDFFIYCDYNEVDMTQNDILNVFIDQSKTPSIVQKVKYHPSTVEFIKLN